MTDSTFPTDAHVERAARLTQLRENELDLSTQLYDLVDELATRSTAIGATIALLRFTSHIRPNY